MAFETFLMTIAISITGREAFVRQATSCKTGNNILKRHARYAEQLPETTAKQLTRSTHYFFKIQINVNSVFGMWPKISTISHAFLVKEAEKTAKTFLI